MITAITRRQSPEERELEKKKAELAGLGANLAQQELELATLQAELRAFERRYLSIVGVRYAELDAVEAQIAEAQARLYPQSEPMRAQAEQARAQARDSARASAEAQTGAKKFEPSEDLKKLYRDAAKRVHPDRASDDADRARRNKVMAEVNRAFEDGDTERLQAILLDWEDSPESVKGESIGAELVRIIRKIAQIEVRLNAIRAQIEKLKAADLYQLRRKVETAEAEGRDLLAEMAMRVEGKIRDARRRLLDMQIGDLETQLAELKRRRDSV